MPALLLFLFKVNMALVVFCLGYYLMLRHLTFYTLNRIYLVLAILFSTLYPSINLSDFAQRHQQLTMPVQAVMLNWKAPAESFVKPLYQPNYWQWVEMVFWAGVILFAARLIMQLFSLYKLYRQSQPGEVHNYQVRLINDDVSPFSFWRSIYINPSKLSPSELKSVLEHEQVHVSQWHTLDVLLAELSVIFYWFNPGVWLMKKAVRENVEFITDRKILQKGADSKEYQYSLVSVSLASPSNTIVNHFNMSTIKKRIIMMNTKRSAGYNLSRYLFLVPGVIALLLIFSLSKAEVAKHTIKSIATAIKNVALVNNDQPDTHPVKQPKKIIGVVPTKIKITTADTLYAGKSKDGKKAILLTSDKNMDSIGYVINGVKSSRANLLSIDPAHIVSLDMVSAKDAKEFITDVSDKPNFLFITTDDSEPGKKLKEKMDKTMGAPTLAGNKNTSVITIDRLSDKAPSAQGSGISYSISSNTSPDGPPEPPIAVDVKSEAVTAIAMNTAPKVSTSVKTFKNVSITKAPKVVVTVRGFSKDTLDVDNQKIVLDKNVKTFVYTGKFKSNDELTINGAGEPLFIVDGKETKSLKKVSPADIKSITVLKDGSAEKEYGEKGKNGVVVITTKKGQ